ncbi:tripartite tricarboxylate transporter permease [Pseudoalteromonas sp. SR44-5]|jgi:putative tricarboxylic transport membrane protein|uniref:Tripartite tricarboxylate transporter permease n=2 Tax=Pseudoalteromonas TaxID=53246 RepID=A0ABY3FBN6_9GAMM|nr:MULTISPECIES: tripartite tricarboxylate transporter permease [Pseudoalteromonas]MBB1299974.1 tripartite tricarboxylate transporter permease [Pseudoalteromonas sp. SR44-8]MBB1309146.1 tripartite tricarboxylate transporter permease [Pseudoalteromonas sp. SR41-8]MBB1332301.1 tripartite tricarboxylate transporter permease [Pseudoalteromonas sp. SR41-6]MBB1340694.1 tripartite tricarboxylate transporter permease [Pseudoalteromonas sp. SR45-6]MBB1365638.1 tripartite tricarboxylate transporter perm|tara:strand:+ start:10432 stop:11973 length:1542 start_codon:yes stop_codon:yes gene_type:complete
MFDGIMLGLSTVLDWNNLLYVIVGCFVGTFIGMLPGLGPITAIALMIPITYSIGADSGMILMAGVYYGAIFGGSTSSILINAPGVAGTVASSFDGYPLAKQGHAGKALAIAAYSSFIGGTIGAILLMVAAPLLAKVSLSFQSPDYVVLMFLGLTAIAAFSNKGQFLKAMMMTVFGLMLATVGIDPSSGTERFTLGQADLLDGISFLLVAMATFALAEALINVVRPEKKETKSINDSDTPQIGSTKLTKEEIKDIAPVIGRSSILGFIVGVLPGAGATIASFMAYATERNLAPKGLKEKFGKGSLRGLAAPESANNAACTGSFVPLLTLGIPGSGTTAIMLGALIAYGIQPGPMLMQENPSVFWAVIVSMYFGNIVLLILNLPLIPYFAKVLAMPKSVLTIMILFFSLIGVYLVSFNTFDLFMMVGFAVVALVLRLLAFPMAPLLLGFILGDMIERNFRRSMMISDGSLSFLWERPLTLSIFIISILVLLFPLKDFITQRRADKAALKVKQEHA